MYLVKEQYSCSLASNLVPRLSSLRSSLEEQTLVNVAHVTPRFWEPACEG